MDRRGHTPFWFLSWDKKISVAVNGRMNNFQCKKVAVSNNQMNSKSVSVCNYGDYTPNSRVSEQLISWFLVHLGPFFYNDNKILLYLRVCVCVCMTLPLSFPGFKGCITDKQQCFLNQPDCSFHSSIHLDALSHFSDIADDNVSLQYCRSVDIDLKILPVNKSQRLFVSSGISSCQTTMSPADMKT